MAFYSFGSQDRSSRFAIVAIPAKDEAGRIEACLTALAVQRDAAGAPLAAERFAVLVFANNSSDETVTLAEAVAARSPHPITVVVESLPPGKSNAGWARKRAMDLAADRLIEDGHHDGVILTTDADSTVGMTWVDATLRAIDAGADGVAGYVDAHPLEITRLGRAFLNRSRAEDSYLRAIAEIYALCDPRPHDPWPNHRVSSGASLAVTLPAYLAIGGLPPKPVGEDAALTAALESAGLKVRHAMDVCVSTSCRIDGRARGGAADTIRLRHGDVEAPCDDEIEPAFAVVRRALCKGVIRRAFARGIEQDAGFWARRLGLSVDIALGLVATQPHAGFDEIWQRLSAESPVLRERTPLRPADLPRQIDRAALCLRALRGSGVSRTTDAAGDTADRAQPSAPAAA